MSSDVPTGHYLRRNGSQKHHWCYGRPIEEHVRPFRGRGDIWICAECYQVWIGVLRPSLLDGIPHWSIKWKRMCNWRARRWREKDSVE